MKPKTPEADARRRPPATSELLILPDGRVLAHNLTPAFIRLLAANKTSRSAHIDALIALDGGLLSMSVRVA